VGRYGKVYCLCGPLLESDLPPDEKLHSRLWQEGLVVVGAGSDTTAFTLTVIHFWLLEKPEILRRLKAELESVMPDKFALPQLNAVEKLPYMVSPVSNTRIVHQRSNLSQNACINEGLRYYVCPEPRCSS